MRLSRVLASDDRDLSRWLCEDDLSRLPVSSHPDLTPEERVWVGEAAGTVGGSILLLIGGLAGLYLASAFSDSAPVVSLLIGGLGAVLSLIAFRRPWRFATAGDPERLSHLKARKARLRSDAAAADAAARTAFDVQLQVLGGWRRLSPREFEFAVGRHLEKEGFHVEVTRASGDGGVDIDAVDALGRPTIVQAKRYASRVGVNVVREMIGVRAAKGGTPRTIIFALEGFTKGAQELARAQDIELLDARSLTLLL